MIITNCEVKRHTLDFLRVAKTSRDSLIQKEVWYVKIQDSQGRTGYGEIAPLFGLSTESREDILGAIRQMASGSFDSAQFDHIPSVRTGIEMALLDAAHNEELHFFESSFSQGNKSQIINGLIWMGDHKYMRDQIVAKLDGGFRTIKLKIGAIDFDQELDLLSRIRREFGPADVTLRVDANGAFGDDAAEKLKRLSEFQIHSIEQPIRQGQIEKMARLCENPAVDIALDEELIGVNDLQAKRHLLNSIKPQYIILKPSLIGGFEAADQWISIAEELGCSWWATSALESNVGLSAISQWVSEKNNFLPQGLGTGQLFANNSPSNLSLEGEQLFCNVNSPIGFERFFNGLDSVQ